MSLYKRSDRWHYDFAVAGQRYRGSTGEASLAHAEKVEVALMAKALARGPHTLLPRRAPVLSEFAGRFVQWVESAQLLEFSSKRYYNLGWKLIRATPLAGMRLDRITTDDAEAVHFPGSSANVNRALRTLRRMLGKAVEWGVIPHAPRIKLAKEYGRSALIDPHSEARLLAMAEQPLRDVLLLMMDTGMRPQEVFRIRWEHVNWDQRTLFIPFGKTRNSRRYVPLSERVTEALRRRSEDRRDGWVFPSNSKSGHLTTVARQFNRAREKAGIDRSVVLYCARHSFATHALAVTGNLAAVMKAMGIPALKPR